MQFSNILLSSKKKKFYRKDEQKMEEEWSRSIGKFFGVVVPINSNKTRSRSKIWNKSITKLSASVNELLATTGLSTLTRSKRLPWTNRSSDWNQSVNSKTIESDLRVLESN